MILRELHHPEERVHAFLCTVPSHRSWTRSLKEKKNLFKSIYSSIYKFHVYLIT